MEKSSLKPVRGVQNQSEGFWKHLGSLFGTILAPRRVLKRFVEDVGWNWSPFEEAKTMQKTVKPITYVLY